MSVSGGGYVGAHPHEKPRPERLALVETLVRHESATGLNEWAAKVLEEARSHIPAEKRDTVQLVFSKNDDKIDTRFKAPSEYVGFVKQAIETFLEQMPITTQQVFRVLLERIQKE